MIENREIRECYLEDTIGRKYHPSIVTKNKPMRVNGENGDVTTVILDKPMKWNEFKNLSDSLKTSYIVHLVNKYNCGINELCEMFGCVRSTFYNNVTRPLALNECFKRGHRLTKDERKAWNAFLNPIDTCEAAEDTTDETTESVDEVKVPTAPTMDVAQAGFTLRGKFDFIKLTDLINALVNEGDDCVVSVHISKSE